MHGGTSHLGHEGSKLLSYDIIEWGLPLEACTRTTPDPTAAEVLLRVEACGVCRSDLAIWAGYFDAGSTGRITMADKGVELPFTMGHEIAGEVVAVGPDVTRARPGMRAVVYPWGGCGGCEACTGGRELLCRAHRHLGTRLPGGFADHVLVPDERLLLDFGSLPIATACTAACAGLTAYSAVRKVRDLSEADALLVIGLGGLGLGALNLLPAVTPATPIAVDVSPAKRRAAAAAGVAATVDAAAPDAAAQVKAVAPSGVQAALDFVGSPETAQLALDCLAKGGTYVIVGLFGGSLTIGLPHLPFNMRTIAGSYLGSPAEMRELLDLLDAGRVAPVPVEIRPLAAVNEALRDLADGTVAGRLVLQP